MIPVTLLECTLYGHAPLNLGVNPGSSLRGALYEALTAMYDTGESIQSRQDFETNPAAWLMRPEDPESTGGKDVPRPMAIRPPVLPERLQNHPYQAGTTQTCVIALYGRAHAAAGLILSALASAGAIGIGPGRQHGSGYFTLSGVRALDPLTGHATEIIDTNGRQVAELPLPPSREAYQNFAQLLRSDRLTIRFITPTRIIDQQTIYKKPDFRPWFQRLLERIRLISVLYAEPVWIPFEELIHIARTVQVIQDQTQWQDMWSHSRSDHRYKPTSGFIGQVEYAGEFALLLPYLLLGQALQVGKNTMKGCGWYEMSCYWR